MGDEVYSKVPVTETSSTEVRKEIRGTGMSGTG